MVQRIQDMREHDPSGSLPKVTRIQTKIMQTPDTTDERRLGLHPGMENKLTSLALWCDIISDTRHHL